VVHCNNARADLILMHKVQCLKAWHTCAFACA